MLETYPFPLQQWDKSNRCRFFEQLITHAKASTCSYILGIRTLHCSSSTNQCAKGCVAVPWGGQSSMSPFPRKSHQDTCWDRKTSSNCIQGHWFLPVQHGSKLGEAQPAVETLTPSARLSSPSPCGRDPLVNNNTETAQGRFSGVVWKHCSCDPLATFAWREPFC
jgi:hypothetical protein